MRKAGRPVTRTIIERAYDLARSGEAADIQHIRMRLSAEGYVQIDAHLDGARIRSELRALIAGSRAAALTATL